MIHSNKITLSTKPPKVKYNSAWGEITEIYRSEFGYEAYIRAEEIFHVTFSEQLFNELGLEPGKMIGLGFNTDELKVI